MANLDAIREIARQKLAIPADGGRVDWFLWEHTQRVVGAASAIVRLEGLDDGVDPIVLTCAAWFYDAGWAVEYHQGHVAREAIRAKVTTSVQRELGASLMADALKGTVDARRIDLASACIRALGERPVDRTDARVILDADSLEDCGPLCLWQMIRQNTFEGRGMQGVLDAWQARQQYGYWNALINESIRFESVKTIARRRLAQLDQFVDQLRASHTGEDLRAAERSQADRS